MMANKSKGRVEKFNKNAQILDFKKANKEKEKREKKAKKTAKKSKEKQTLTEAEEKHIQRKSNQKNRRRWIYVGVIIILVLVVSFSAWNIMSLKMEQNKLEAQQKNLEQQKKDLNSELGDVNDPDYIEEQARKQLNLVMPGETLYVLPSDESKDSKNDSND